MDNKKKNTKLKQAMDFYILLLIVILGFVLFFAPIIATIVEWVLKIAALWKYTFSF